MQLTKMLHTFGIGHGHGHSLHPIAGQVKQVVCQILLACQAFHLATCSSFPCTLTHRAQAHSGIGSFGYPFLFGSQPALNEPPPTMSHFLHNSPTSSPSPSLFPFPSHLLRSLWVIHIYAHMTTPPSHR